MDKPFLEICVQFRAPYFTEKTRIKWSNAEEEEPDWAKMWKPHLLGTDGKTAHQPKQQRL